ncbi:YcnI family protein [Saccharothrix sp. S26]|uniref:YcnI family copper-binding membrane protein n=1 Tax=Saccharothrix sp. S26 TaxID=2907215 RepID=UPI001F36555E|nr:YcnI family protein [Saccharothrix sp. S26]MCE6999246.1 YcnI family protein [Saccharothrix sp. S26]
MSGSPRRAALTLVLAAFASAAVTVLSTPVASAHVTVSPGTAQPGGYARVVFRVPNERDDASTTRVEVSFPTDHRFASASVQPVPGWTATTSKVKVDPPAQVGGHTVTEAVTTVVWEGGTVLPGQFQEFPVSLGPLPAADTKLVFKAVQTYSSGEVVRWIDVEREGESRPEHPAPTLSVVAAPAPTPVAPDSDVDALGRVLGGAGLLAGLAAIALVVVGRRRSAPPADGGAARAAGPGVRASGEGADRTTSTGNEPARV